MIYVFGKDERFIALLDNESKKACPYYDTDEDEILNGEHTFSFRVPADHNDVKYIEERGFVAVKDDDDQFSLFVITGIEETYQGSSEKRISTESASVELLDDMIEELSFETLDIQLGAERVLNGTRWKVGTVQGGRSRSLNVKNLSVFETLSQLIDLYEYELRFRVRIVGNKIEERFVDFFQVRGAENGKRVEFEKDLRSIRRTIDATNIKTAIYPIGRENDETGERLTIESIEWSKPENPLDKPMGEKILLDPDALEKWGRPNADGTKRHNILILESDAEDPINLMNFSYRTLEKVKEPIVEYEIDVIDLANVTDAPHERIRLGDVIYIIDHDLDLVLSTRVIGRKRNRLDPTSNTFTCGNFIADFTNELDRQRRELSNMRESIGQVDLDGVIREGDTIKTDWLEDQIILHDKMITAGGGTVHITDTDGILITDKPTIAESTTALRLVAGQLGLANEKNPDGSFNFRSFGTADGFLADLAQFGHITFNHAKGGTLQLGGIENQNGILILYDTDGEEIATLSGDYGGFDQLRIDVLKSSRNILTKTLLEFYEENVVEDEIIFYVDPVKGNDDNVGTVDSPKQTVQTIIDSLPKYLDHTVRIRYNWGLLRDNAINIIGFTGTGRIILEKHFGTIRYIRDWTRGNTANNSNHWKELRLRLGNNNIATAGGDVANILTNVPSDQAQRLGEASNASLLDFADLGTNNGNPVYIDIYLRGNFSTGQWVEVYHHESNGRTYRGTKTEISEDRSTWHTIFDSEREGEYVEVAEGQKHTVIHCKLNGWITVASNTIRVEIRDLFINGMASEVYPINLEYNQFVMLVNVVSFAHPNVAFNTQIVGGRAQILNSEFNGAKTALIASRAGSTVEAIDNVGGDAPHVFNARGSVIIGAGTSPRGQSGLSNNTGGGQTFGSFTQTLGVFTAQRIVEKTQTWNNTASRSYDDNAGSWRADHTDVLQGRYSSFGLYRGLWFFGQSVRNAVNGKTIKKIRVFVTRANSSGNVSGSTLELRAHGFATQPSGQPSFIGSSRQVTIDRGQSMWVDVTTQFKDAFQNGSARGFGIYTTSTASDRYIRMTGSSRIEITYDDIE